jgi:glycosyltransferase involved in cell wall biosynthesis
VSPRPRGELCFVAPKAYGILSGDTRVRHIGGAEVQQCLLAQGLARRGRAVSMVTLDEGQGSERAHGGVVAFRSYGLHAGLPGLRFFWPRVTHVWAAMRRADAAAYYQRTSDSLTGVVAAFCRLWRRRFVFAVGEDGDCLPSLPNCRTGRERALFRFGLRRADVVVAQTRWQQEALVRHFGVRSVLIRSAAPDAGEPKQLPREGRPRFLWAGRVAPQKRPELLIELARRCPGTDFDVVGAAQGGASGEAFATAAAALPNVRLHGFVPHAELGTFYDQATALVCTSVREGFPNTFLEAWTRARPVLTTVDPDEVVRREGVGLVASGPAELTEATLGISARGEDWAAMSRRARAYYLREHRPDRILDDYEALLRELLSRDGVSCSP